MGEGARSPAAWRVEFGARAALLLAFVIALSEGVWAHGMDANRASLRLGGNLATLEVTPGVQSFLEYDDDGDGSLATAEVARHRSALLEQFTARFTLADQAGVMGEPVFEDVSTPHAHDAIGEAGVDHLKFTFRYSWSEAPTALVVRWRDARETPLEVTAIRVEPSPRVPEQVPSGPPEHVRLDAHRPAHAFFGVMEPRRNDVGATTLVSVAVVLTAPFVGALLYRSLRRRRSRRA